MTVRETDSLRDVIAKMRAECLDRARDLAGWPLRTGGHAVITRKDILDTLADDMELFG